MSVISSGSAHEVAAGMVLFAGKLCDPVLSTFEISRLGAP